VVKYKTGLSLACQLALFLVWHHHDPIGADVLGILFVTIFVGLALRIYFASIKSKRESITKYKTRHGIPLDMPHKIDDILKEGFFRAN
jgi:hypothetical protein